MADPSLQGYDHKLCRELLKFRGLKPVCHHEFCAEFQAAELYDLNCAKDSMYSPVQAMGCYNSRTGEWRSAPPQQLAEVCAELMSADESWEFRNCYCCCGYEQAQTRVGVPAGGREISQIGDGEEVLAASVGSDGALQWRAATVNFSQGIAGVDGPLVSLAYGEPEQRMIATVDLPLMLSDGLLSIASRIRPGVDCLMGVDGEPLPVNAVGLREGPGAVHHIALSRPWEGCCDGHLIALGAVVAGDFTLQLHLAELPDEQLASGLRGLPEIGTPQYTHANPHLRCLMQPLTYAVS